MSSTKLRIRGSLGLGGGLLPTLTALALLGCTPKGQIAVSQPAKTQPPVAIFDLKLVTAVADSVATAQIAAGLTPGLSVAVAQDGKIVFAKGYGQANVEAAAAAGPNTVYEIASVTKQFTAAAILRLAEQGELSLADPISKYLPGYPLQGHRVTVRQLLNHTSGIKSYTNLPGFQQPRVYMVDHSYQEMIDLFGKLPFDFEPGEKFSYNNSGYYLLGEIISRVTGMPYAAYVEQQLLQPLGLRKTMISSHRRVIPNRAQGYAYDSGQLIHAPYHSLGTSSPATGGLCSTMDDLVRWTHLLHAGQVVSSASYQEMTTPAHLSSGKSTGYGFGLRLYEFNGHAKIAHGGERIGVGAFLAYYPQDKATVVVLANSAEVDAEAVEELIALALFGVAVRNRPLTAGEMTAYEGEYSLQLGPQQGKVRVFREGGQLMVHLVGQGTSRLLYQGNQAFLIEVAPDFRLAFHLAEGQADSLTLYVKGKAVPGKRQL